MEKYWIKKLFTCHYLSKSYQDIIFDNRSVDTTGVTNSTSTASSGCSTAIKIVHTIQTLYLRMAILPYNCMHLFATLLFQEKRGGERTLPEIQYNLLRSLMEMLCIQNEGYPLHSWIQLTLFLHFVGNFFKKNKARTITVAVYPIGPKAKTGIG